MASGVPASVIDPLVVARLAADILATTIPATAAYAEVMAPHLVSIPGAGGYAAELIKLCRASGVPSASVDLWAAQLAYVEGRFDDACRLFEAAACAVDGLSVDTLDDYLVVAANTGVAADGRNALEATSRALEREESPAERVHLLRALGSAIYLSEQLGEPLGDLVAVNVRVLLQVGDESQARRPFETWQPDMKLAERLDVLSVFEDAEQPATAEWMLANLQQVVDEASRQPNGDLFARAVDQLQIVEVLLGHLEHGYSMDYIDDLTRRQEASAVSPTPTATLGGLTLAIVGGNPRRRQRLSNALHVAGATQVRHVPPHWEARVDRRVMTDGLAGPHAIAVLLTDEVGHQEQALLRGMHGNIAFVRGGPSRVLRELRQHISDFRGQ